MASTSAEGGGLGGGGGMKVESGSGCGGGEGGGVGADGTEQAVVGMVRMGSAAAERDKQKMVGIEGSFVAAKKARRERIGSTAKERISKMPPCTAGKRSSIYRGVTRHRWTGRYEAHLWDKSTWNQNQNKKGKQVYLGAYDDEEVAARAYDLAALKYWGPGTLINFPVSDYTRDLEEMQNVSREEYLASLRRKSSGFSRGISKFRGLASGRWEPSLGRSSGSEYLQSIHYGPTGDNAAADSEYGGGLCIERKIDLTGYIKWWGSNNRFRPGGDQSKSSEGVTRHMTIDEVCNELKPMERAILSTEPYQMPQLGMCLGRKKTKSGGSPLSALSILSRSPAYRSLEERCSKAKEAIITENNENENKSNIVDRIKEQRGKAVDKSTVLESGVTRSEEASTAGEDVGAVGVVTAALNRNMFPLSPLLSAPLLTGYSSIDPLADPLLWSSIMPVLPGGPSSQSIEVTKTENSPSFLFRQEEG